MGGMAKKEKETWEKERKGGLSGDWPAEKDGKLE